jgi:hypothetical protein
MEAYWLLKPCVIGLRDVHVNGNVGTSTGHSIWKPEVAREICTVSNYVHPLGADYYICIEDETGGIGLIRLT